MKKLFTKILSLTICFILGVTVVGCGGPSSGGGTGNETTIVWAIESGGMGRAWADSAKERFEQKYAETSFEEGKKGVKIEIDQHTISLSTSKISAYDVYAFDHYAADYSLLSKYDAGHLAKITDVVTDKSETINGVATSIEDKILPENRAAVKGSDGEYYAIPFQSSYSGMSYDVELFDRMGFYFADSPTDAIEFHSDILDKDFYFVVGEQWGNIDNKSYGPDGQSGGGDDGLPATLHELIALCEYMRTGTTTVYPFLITGQYPNMANFILEGLTTSLLGYDRAKACYDLSGEIEVITGFTDEPLFPGVPEIKKPTTQKVVLTEENGYYFTWAVEKYYAQAFFELVYSQDWLHPDALIGTVNQRDVMLSFIFNGVELNRPLAGMLSEASFWYVESEIGKYPQRYDGPSGPNHDGHAPRKIEFMPLPLNFDESGENTEQVFAEYGGVFLGINSRITEQGSAYDEGKLKASKELIKFLSSNEENVNFNVETGLKKPLVYDLPANTTLRFHYYNKLADLLSTSKLLSFYSATPTFNYSSSIFQKGYHQKNYGAGGKNDFFTYIKEVEGANAMDAFQEKIIEKDTWNNYYKGSGTITDYNGIVFTKK